MRPLTGALRTPRLVGRGGVAREAALLPALLDSRPVAPAPGCHTPFALFLEGKPVLPAAPLLGLSWHVLQARPWAPTPRAARLLTFLPPSPPPRSSLQAPRPASVLSHRCSDSSGGACFWWVRGGGWVEAEEHQSCSAAASGALPTPELARTTLDLPCTFAHCVCFLGEPPLGAGNPARMCPRDTFSPPPCVLSSLPRRSPQRLLDGMLLQALSEASVCFPSDGAWPRRCCPLWKDLDTRAGVRKASILEAAGPVTWGNSPRRHWVLSRGRGRPRRGIYGPVAFQPQLSSLKRLVAPERAIPWS